MKPWTMKDDRFLHAHHDVGASLLASDLGRSASSIKKRIARLKGTGAWNHLSRIEHEEVGYRVRLGLPIEADIVRRWQVAEHFGITMSEV